MGGRGNSGVRNSTPTVDKNFQRFLDKNGGDEDFAIKDWLYEDIPDHIEYQGKEYEVLWQNSIRYDIISRPTGEQFDKDLIVTAQVDLYDEETGKRVDNYWLKDHMRSNKRRRFHIPYYE